ncbi:glycosyl hydrolase family 28-related protein [Rhodoblastus sp.]|uniref:glycosyl hydrolase family 28-related protein n=1 Tax=Rhodoblastus sp. TaxID=1962975 RepID=UPI00262CDF9B|nr:glycosyl hydrolase family 28-related protein [Rhodoblastus sp.]
MRGFSFLISLYALFLLDTSVRAQNAVAACPQGGSASDIYVGSFGARPDGVTDSTDAINRALACAVSSKVSPVTVHFDSGAYLAKCSTQSNTSCFKLVGNAQRSATGVNVAGQGSSLTTILIGNPDSGGFYIKNATSVSISGLTIDYVTPPFVQGKIIAVNADSFDFRVLPGGMQGIPDYLCRAYGTGRDKADVSPGKTLGIFPGSSYGMVMDANNGRSLKHNAMPGATVWPTACSKLTASVWRLGVKPGILKYLSVGDNYIQLIGRYFTKSGIWSDSSNDITISNVDIRSAGGFGTVFTLNNGTIHLNHVQIRIAPNSKRFLTTNADAVHMQHNWAKPLIENSYFEGMADDAVNIFAIGLFASDTSPDGRIIEVRVSRPVHVGDSIEILSADTGTLRGTATITSVAAGRDNAHIALTITPPIPGVSAAPSGDGADIVFDVSAAGPKAVIQSNTFGRHRGRDILDRSIDSLIADNKFLDVNWNAIVLAASSGAVPEGPTADGVTIRGNQIYGGDLPWAALIAGGGLTPHGDVAYGPVRISISNNTLSSPVEKGIALKGANHLTIKNNKLFSLSCDNPKHIDIKNSTAVTVAGNSCAKGPFVLGSGGREP